MKIPITLPRQIWFAIFGIALLLALIWVALKSGPLAPIQVTVTQVAKGEVSPALFGIGTVEARRAYLIGPTAAGRVGRVLVDVGDSVQAGQLLAEMDPVDLDARVNSAAAAAARARNAVATAQAQVQDAQGRQALAAIEARRYVDLGRKGFVSQSVVDGRLQQQQSADAQLAAAESSLASARQDLARLDADREGVKQQRVNIRLNAPTDGVVTSRDAEPGTTIVAGQAVLKLVQPDSLWITVRLDQGRSAGLRVGLPAEITLRSSPHKNIAGKVVRVEPVSDDTEKGRHTTAAAQLLPLRFGGYVVDTPGVRQFQLWDVIPEEVAGFYRDLRPYVSLCKFPDCTHTHEAECAVKDAVADGRLDERRYESYCSLFLGEMD